MGSTLNMSCGTKWLAAIEISAAPIKTAYQKGEVFDPAGMVATAIYTDGTKAQVTGYTWMPTGTLTEDAERVTISYTEGWVTRTAAQAITVSGGIPISVVPTQSGTLTYSESSQTPVWSDYDTEELSIGGTTSATDAGTYTATFTPKTGYVWWDGTSAAKSASWSIDKAEGSLSLSSTSVALTGTNAATVVVTRAGDGEITAVSSSPAVAIVEVDGTNVTVTYGGSGRSATVTVSVAEGTNYTAPESKTITVLARIR